MIRKTRITCAGLGVATLALVACAEPDVAARGDQLYADHCQSCHGASGKGDGPAAAGLSPAPADLTVLSRRNGGVFPMAEVMSTIDGYGKPGTASAMPEFGVYLEDADQVLIDLGDGVMTRAPEPLVAVAEYLRTLQDP